MLFSLPIVWSAAAIVSLLVAQVQSEGKYTAICDGTVLKGFVSPDQRLLPPNGPNGATSGSGQCLSSGAFAIGTAPNFQITATEALKCGNGAQCPGQTPNPNTAICDGTVLKGYLTPNQRMLPQDTWQTSTESGSAQCLSSGKFAIAIAPSFPISATGQLMCGPGEGPNCPT